ncbi:PREDICTED: NAC domain-containing protein 90-like [Ipomoea nil]|uniref:NAC domain-containing protein 90-like n=1 Tax=Ipomoea nil TaxID=35883 RepID=UPI000901CF2F|nr:PREDICTED: NAC domain-containing protein 90-like [Ipomoea nil]
MAEITPGFRFYPTEEELLSFYLHNKLEGTRQDINCVIPMINIFDLEPWHLPKVSGELCVGETEQWFFFVPRQEREARGGRPCRTTAAGYWKATGSPSYVYSSDNKVIGVKKSMVFYKGKSPCGRKTKWKMNEYRAIEEQLPSSHLHPSYSSPLIPSPKLRHEMTLCRVYVILRNFGSFDRRPIGNMGTSQEEVKMIPMEAINKCSESSVVQEEEEEEDFDDGMNVYATTGLTRMVKSPEPFSGLERLINFQLSKWNE